MRLQLATLFSLAATSLLGLACSDDPVVVPPPVTTPDSGVVVIGPASIVDFSATPTPAPAGESVVIHYDVGTATSVVVSRVHAGAALVLYAGPAPRGRMDSGPIHAATTFEIRAWGNGGKPTGTLVVDVDVPAVVIRAFTATPDPADVDEPITLAWDVDGATRVRVLDEMRALVDTSSTTGELRLTAVSGLRKLVLEASSPWRTVTQAIELRTREPASVVTFAPDPPTFGGGSSNIRLSWDTRGERVAIVANGVPVPIVRPQAITSSTALRVTQPTLLELSVESQGRSVLARRIATNNGVLEREPNEDTNTATILTHGAIGRVDGEWDVDTFRTSVMPGAQLYVQLTDPRGRCLAGAGLRIVDGAGNEVLQRSSTNGGCVFLDPHEEPRVRAMAGGEYFISVQAGAVTQYALAVLSLPAVCGNDILERGAGEECDDGGTTSGDGCSSTCIAEVVDTIRLPGAPAHRSGRIAAGRVDYYRLEVTQEVMATLETGAPDVGRCDTPGADTVLTVTDAAGNVVGQSDDELGLCAGFTARAPLSLVPGSYLVTVSAFAADGVVPAYGLRVAGAEPRCGDDIVAASEACDDGNTADGDGCSARCTVERLPPGGGQLALDVPSGAVRVVDVQVTRAGQSITATTSDGAGGCGVDTRLVLAHNGAYLGYVSNGRGCAIISPRDHAFAADLEVGTYRIYVVGEGATGGPVTLDVAVTDPVCGNGIRESRVMETCDDGNLADDDGCSSTCERTVGGTVRGPGMLPTTPTVLGGSVLPGGDMQLFGIEMSAPGFLFARMGMPTLNQCFGGDPVIEVFDANMNTLAFNDDSMGLCSAIDPRVDFGARLAAGRFTLGVRSLDNRSAIPAFEVQIDLRPEGCGNEVVERLEQCDDGNRTSGDGCSVACQAEP